MKNIGKVWWLIFLLFLSCGHVFSQETEGIQISDRLYTFLTEKNIHAEKHPLAGFKMITTPIPSLSILTSDTVKK